MDETIAELAIGTHYPQHVCETQPLELGLEPRSRPSLQFVEAERQQRRVCAAVSTISFSPPWERFRTD